MSVNKIYQENVYMCSCQATITRAKQLNDNSVGLYLDRTVFFPEGGGQSCDTGTINGYQVTDVQEDGDDIIHTVNVAPDAFSEGKTVECNLNWPRRFDNMQRHCGEHILSGMFFKAYGGVNRGFHMGDEYMTVDISLEAKPEFKTLTMDMALHVQEMTNAAIWENLPVITRRFATREEAEGLPLRKALAIDEEISIVCVGDISEPSDCVACCGTHPSTSGQVGLVKIFKVEKNKEMFRVYFEAGKRAMADYNNKHSIITELGTEFSAGTSDLLSKIKAQDDKNKIAREELTELRKLITSEKASEIQASTENFFTFQPPFTAEDAMNAGKQITRPFFSILAEKSNTLLLFSDGSTDCGALVKESGLKGGGNKKMARAIGNSQQLSPLIDKIKTL